MSTRTLSSYLTVREKVIDLDTFEPPTGPNAFKAISGSAGQVASGRCRTARRFMDILLRKKLRVLNN